MTHGRMCFQVQVTMVALSVVFLVSEVNAAPRGETLVQLLQNEADPKGNEELSRVLVLKLLKDLDLASVDNEALSDTDVRSDVVRQLPFPQRERKTGCRNFFWKTFTSC